MFPMALRRWEIAQNSGHRTFHVSSFRFERRERDDFMMESSDHRECPRWTVEIVVGIPLASLFYAFTVHCYKSARQHARYSFICPAIRLSDYKIAVKFHGTPAAAEELLLRVQGPRARVPSFDQRILGGACSEEVNRLNLKKSRRWIQMQLPFVRIKKEVEEDAVLK